MQYPIFLVGFSGGKDSVATVLHLLDLGVPKNKIHLHHHDVDGGNRNLFDWECTKSYCIAFAKAFDLEIMFSYREGGIEKEMTKHNAISGDYMLQYEQDGIFNRVKAKGKPATRRKFPAITASLMTRWCSAHAKIDPFRRAITNNPRYKTGTFVVCTGERREESAARSKYHELSLHVCNTKKRTVYEWKPVIDYTEQQVWDALEKYKVQPHPAYVLGWSRCSCQTCIFNDNDTWATIAKISPEKFNILSDYEVDFSFTMHNKMSLHKRKDKGVCFLDTDKDEFWINQATKDFNAPIIVEEWTLPKGAFSKRKQGSL